MANAFKTACYITNEPEEYPNPALDAFLMSALTMTSYTNPNANIINRMPYSPSLRTASFPNCSFININAFSLCSNLSTIYFMSNSICSMAFDSSIDPPWAPFTNTKITSTTGKIYVPSALLSSYKSTAGWSYYKSVIYGV